MAIVRDISGNRPNNAPIVDQHYDKDNPTYSLAFHKTTLADGDVTQALSVAAGAYILDYRADDWNGGTLVVETLSADGTNYDTVVSVTSDGKQGITLGQNAIIRLRGTVATVSDLSVSLT